MISVGSMELEDEDAQAQLDEAAGCMCTVPLFQWTVHDELGRSSLHAYCRATGFTASTRVSLDASFAICLAAVIVLHIQRFSRDFEPKIRQNADPEQKRTFAAAGERLGPVVAELLVVSSPRSPSRLRL
jgi:hypothetical protein